MMKGTMMLEPPDKMSMDVVMTSADQSAHVMAVMTGNDIYMKVPEVTGTPTWYKMASSDVPGLSTLAASLESMEGMSPEEVQFALSQGGMQGTLCSYVGDIPDSEFLPPAGAQVEVGVPQASVEL
jgi:hypothetical protein